MIDTKKGAIFIPEYDLSINKHFLHEHFRDSKLYNYAIPIIMNPPFRSYRIKYPTEVMNEQFIVSLYFNNQNLWMMNMRLNTSEGSKDWDSWSKDEEEQIHRLHNQLLHKMIGLPPYIYSWGKITSDFDMRVGSAVITINFNQ